MTTKSTKGRTRTAKARKNVDASLETSNASAVALRYVLPSLHDLALPNVEGTSPRAAFNAFMDHAKRILHPSVLYELLGSKLHDLGTKDLELSLHESTNLLREQCTEEQGFLRNELGNLVAEVERYVKANASHPLIPERLGWMIGQVEAWTPEKFHGDNPMDMPEEQRLAVTVERLRYKERWAGVGEEEIEAQGMFTSSLLGAIFNATELRIEFGKRLEQIAENITVGTPTVTPSATMALPRLEWGGSTIEFITIVKMLVKRKYVDLPSTGGKQGEGNVAEFIRRFQQTFIVRKGDKTEFTTDGLADRWRGTPMGEDREKQFDIPEAMPSNETMEEGRERQFDIPEATRKRLRT